MPCTKAEAVDKVLRRALDYGVVAMPIIRNILEGKLYELVDTVTMPVFTENGNSRELSYYTQVSTAEEEGEV